MVSIVLVLQKNLRAFAFHCTFASHLLYLGFVFAWLRFALEIFVFEEAEP